jgi:hypothetical protein
MESESKMPGIFLAMRVGEVDNDANFICGRSMAMFVIN